MVKRKSTCDGDHSHPQSKKMTDLDPTTNDALHFDTWRRLLKRIKIQMYYSEPYFIFQLLTGVSHRESNLEEDGLLKRSPPKTNNPSGNKDLSNGKTFGKNMRHLVNVVTYAFCNPRKSELKTQSMPFLIDTLVYVPWDVEDYYVEYLKGNRDKNRQKYPNPNFGSHSLPLTVVDSKGRIILWYLPGLLSEKQQV